MTSCVQLCHSTPLPVGQALFTSLYNKGQETQAKKILRPHAAGAEPGTGKRNSEKQIMQEHQ